MNGVNRDAAVRMNLLPLVNRELRTAVRRPQGYRIRLAAAGASVFFSFWAMLVWGGWTAGAALGITLLHALALTGFVATLLSGVILAADCLSQEKREATLGLLWVAGLKPPELVLGKLAGKIVVPFYALIGMLPGFAVCILLGGVTGGEFCRLLLALMNTLFWSVSAGLLASSFCRQQRTAYSSALLLLLLVAGGIPLLGGWAASWMSNRLWADLALLMSPTGSYQFAYAQRYSAGPSWFWGALATNHLMSWIGLGLACGFIAHSSYSDADTIDRKPRSHPKRSRAPEAGLGRRREEELRDTHPIAWLASRRRAGSLLIWSPIVAATWLLLASDLSPLGNARSRTGFLMWYAIHLLFTVWMAGDAAHTFANDRRTGALELLLGTPLEIREIAAGVLQALRRRFVRPALALFTLDALLVLRLGYSNDGASMLIVCAGAPLFLMGSYCVLWVGIWQSMVSRHPSVAALNGVLRILVLPWVWFGIVAGLFAQSSIVELTVAWAILAGVNSLIFFRGARHNVHEHFRVLALRPYGAKPVHIESDWSPINWEAEEPVESVGASEVQCVIRDP